MTPLLSEHMNVIGHKILQILPYALRSSPILPAFIDTTAASLLLTRGHIIGKNSLKAAVAAAMHHIFRHAIHPPIQNRPRESYSRRVEQIGHSTNAIAYNAAFQKPSHKLLPYKKKDMHKISDYWDLVVQKLVPPLLHHHLDL